MRTIALSPIGADQARGAAKPSWVWSCVVVLAFVLPCSAETEDRLASSPNDLLRRAIETYSSAMEMKDRDARIQAFAQAEQLFHQVIIGADQGNPIQNAALLVNVGNAALQAERIGPAILAFRRALLLDPSHIQAQQNLRYARSAIPESMQWESSSDLIDTLFFWRTLYSRRQLMACAALCFLGAAILVAFGLVRRAPVFRNLAVLPAVCWLVLVVSGGWEASGSSRTDAVVIANDLIVRSADSENSQPRLSAPLPSGAEVRVVSQRGPWTEIEVSGGRTGWVRTSGVEPVRAVP